MTGKWKFVFESTGGSEAEAERNLKQKCSWTESNVREVRETESNSTNIEFELYSCLIIWNLMSQFRFT